MKKSIKHLVKACVYGGAAGGNFVLAKHGLRCLYNSFPYKNKFAKGLDMVVGIGCIMLTTAMLLGHSTANGLHYVNNAIKVNDSESVEE